MSNTSYWGNAVWLLFHTLAEKLSETYILNNIETIKFIIILICKNLPCPDCSTHASETLKFANLDKIKSKEHLKYFLWTFHNIVNHKVGNPSVDYEYLENYKKAIPHNVVINFEKKFYKRPYNDKLLISSFTMQGIKNQLNNFFKEILNSGEFTL